jgi:cell division protein ZapA (FtsZ GTPase activity inhibitor)
MSEKIRVLGKEYNVSNPKEIKETIKQLRKELKED